MDSKKSNKRGLNYTFGGFEKVKRVDSCFPDAQHFHESALQQEFSLPMPIMKYIWSYPPSAEINLEYNFSDGWKNCSGKDCYGHSCKNKHMNINMEHLQSKIWITEQFFAFTKQKSNVTSTIIPKIFQHGIYELVLINQELSYDELKFLAASGIKETLLQRNIIKYGNGEEVPLEKLINLFSGAKKVLIDFASAPGDIGCKSYDEFFVACNTIKEVILLCVPLDFNVPEVYQHLKRCKNHSVIEIFADLRYQQRNDLDEVVKEIVQTKSFEWVPPVLKYTGVHVSNYEKMKKIQAIEAAKYH